MHTCTPITTLLAAEAGGHVLVVDIFLILATTSLVAMALTRLKLASIAGFLIAGAIIGPNALGLVTNEGNVDLMTSVAIVLLMFTIGMSLETEHIKGGMVSIVMVGAVSTTASALLIWPIGVALGLGPIEALVIGLALAMSSTAVILRMLQSRRELHRLHGRLALGILLVQDLFAVVVISLMPVLAIWAGGAEQLADGGIGPAVGRGFLAAGAIILLVIVGRAVLPYLLYEAARTGGGGGGGDILIVLSAAIALGASVITSLLGLSMELGAFIAGFLLASTPFRHQLVGQLAPMRDLFMAMFFTAVGLKLDVGVIVDSWWIVLLGIFLLVGIKAVSIGVTTWAAGATGPIFALTALTLAHSGEFSLVVLSAGSNANLISDDNHSLLIAIVGVSLILTPSIISLARQLSPRFHGMPLAPWNRASVLRKHDGESALDEQQHVVIAGFGLVGRAITDSLTKRGVPCTVIELNPETVRKQKGLKRSIVYGDSSNEEVLESARIRSAAAAIITIPDDDAVLRSCRMIRTMAPDMFIAVRTGYMSRAMLAKQAGADLVIVEEIATAEALVSEVTSAMTRQGRLLDESAKSPEVESSEPTP